MWTVLYKKDAVEMSRNGFKTRKSARIWVKQTPGLVDVRFVSPDGEIEHYVPGV